MERTYKVLDDYFLLKKDSIISVKYHRLFDTIVTNWKNNFIVNNNELYNTNKYTLINI